MNSNRSGTADTTVSRERQLEEPIATHHRSGTVRRILSALLTLLVSLGVAGIATPADAAASGSYCFRYSNGAAYNGRPVQLQVSANNANWTTVAHGSTNINGCAYFTTGPYQNYYVRVLAWERMATPNGGTAYIWSGATPLVGLPGSWNVNLGTGTVTCQSVLWRC